MPVESVLLLTLVHGAAEKLLEYFEVDLALGECLGEQSLQMLQIFGDDVCRAGLRVASDDLIHMVSLGS